MGLKFFKRGNYSNVGSALSLVRQEFEALWAKIGDIRPGEEGALAEQQSYIPNVDSSVASWYDGDFTIVVELQYDDSNTETGYTIKVVNGELYKVNKDLNHQCYATINGKTYAIQAKEFANIDLTNSCYVYIVYTAEGAEPSALGEPASKASVALEIISTKDWNGLPYDDATHAYYLIGDVSVGYDNKIYINQGHQSGYVRMYHAMSCSDLLYAVEPEEIPE